VAMLTRIARPVMRRLYYNPPKPLTNFYAEIMIREISRSRPPYGDIDAAIRFVFRYRNILNRILEALHLEPEYAPFRLIPAQIPYEISLLLRILRELKPRRVLEIGTERGGTLFLFTYVADENATIISIDLPPGKYRFGFSYPYWKEKVYKSFGFYNQKIHLIRGDSHDPKTLEKVKRILGGEKLDFLFIDGDHTYEGVRRDFEMYSPLVRRGGIVAFHDIVPGPPENVGGVPVFWSEIKHRYRYLEIVKDWRQGGYGIGVLFL